MILDSIHSILENYNGCIQTAVVPKSIALVQVSKNTVLVKTSFEAKTFSLKDDTLFSIGENNEIQVGNNVVISAAEIKSIYPVLPIFVKGTNYENKPIFLVLITDKEFIEKMPKDIKFSRLIFDKTVMKRTYLETQPKQSSEK